MLELTQNIWARPFMRAACVAAAIASGPLCAYAQRPPDSATTAKALARELAAARKAGLVLNPGALQQPTPPEDRNAVSIYAQIDVALTARQVAPSDMAAIEQLADRRLRILNEVEAARAALARNRSLLDLIHRAAARPDCVYRQVTAKNLPTAIPSYTAMDVACPWLSAESYGMVQAGNPANAIGNQTLGFRIADHIATEPNMIALVSTQRADSIAFTGLERILYLSADNPGVATAVRQAVERNWKPLRLGRALRGETVYSFATLERLRHSTIAMLDKGDLSNLFDSDTVQRVLAAYGRSNEGWKQAVDANEASYLSVMRRLISAAERPFWEVSATERTLITKLETNNSRPDQALADAILPTILAIPPRDSAHAQVVRCAAAILAWKAAHGALPATLAQAISPVPADPFDGHPLRYRREGDGFVVYSVGETGRYDGGSLKQRPPAGETAFRYPMPDYWK